MEIREIIDEANNSAEKYNLIFAETDRTDNIISLKLFIDNELFIQIYANASKKKLNLAVVFKNSRLYGYDSEGGKYHCHPFDNPETHILVKDTKSISEFVAEAMQFLDKSEML